MGNQTSVEATTASCALNPKYVIGKDVDDNDKGDVTQKCGIFHTLVNDKKASLEDIRKAIEAHAPSSIDTSTGWCNRGCEDVYLNEFYETALVRRFLMDGDLALRVLPIYAKLFRAIEKKLGTAFVEGVFSTWAEGDDQFPVSQKNRDWKRYTKLFALQDITSFSHDPTSVLLAADFLKQLANALPESFQKTRDNFHWTVQRRMRGFRSNQKNREGEEASIGIMSYDVDSISIPLRYFSPTPWMHPGRSKCKVTPPQGLSQNAMLKSSIPLKCGMSSSTNFWTWTAMYADNADLTMEEMRLFIFSAFVVLAADGGHSLMEVLGGVASTSIFWHNYSTFLPEGTIASNLSGNGFAEKLYSMFANMNVFGDGNIDCSKTFHELGTAVYGDILENGYEKDVVEPPAEEIERRQTVEAFFLRENSRFAKPFGDYALFLNQMPELETIRNKAMRDTIAFAHRNCKGEEPPPTDVGFIRNSNSSSDFSSDS